MKTYAGILKIYARILIGFITLFFIFFSAAQTAFGQDIKTISVGVPTDRCPLTYKDPDTGEITGIGVDILTAAAENAGYKVTFSAIEKNETLKDALDDDRFDLIAPFGSAIQSTDGKKSALTDSLFASPFVLAVVRGKELNVRSALRIGMISSMAGVGESIKALYPDYQITFYDNWDAAVSALRKGEQDGLLNSAYVWTYLLQKPERSDITVMPSEAISMPYYAGASDTEDHRALIRDLNRGLANVTQTQKQSIILKYTSRHLYRNTFNDSLYENRFFYAFFALLLLIVAVGAINFNRQRNRYVKQLLTVNRSLEDVNGRLEKAANEEKSLRRQADAANVAKSEFLSRMSHDIRTPMNGIIGMTHLAREQDNPAKTEEYLSKIDMCSRFLLSLVNEILDLSKAESGKTELHPEPYYMEDFEAYIDSVIRPLVAEKQQLIFISHPVPGIVPLMDILLVNQIYFNLLTNAVKYSPEGSEIMVNVSEEITAQSKDRITVKISDHGIGMSSEFQKHLFEPFTQEYREEKTERRGTGLGLAIVSKNIEMLGGTISVVSEQGKGSEFTFVIDYDYISGERHRPVKAEKEEPEDGKLLRGMHILLCEDNLINQEIAKALLEEKGAIAETADNGELGVSAFERTHPGYFDFILMDIHMPVMDGYEATRRIRSLDRTDAKTVIIIAMTADAFEEEIQNCLEAGMNAHIAKPIEPEVLYRTLQSAQNNT